MGRYHGPINQIVKNLTMKKISIVAGGRSDKQFIPEIIQSNYVIGVDRGALWLLKHGIVPEIAIGDFDSVTQREKRYIHDRAKTYIEYAPEKDATDLELAIEEAIRLHPKEVRMYGALGKRFDHALAAAHLLLKLVSHNIQGQIVDNFSKIHIVRRQLRLQRHDSFRYISILPVKGAATITLRGFTYEVTQRAFVVGSTLGISNEIASSSATIKVHEGYVLVIQSRDRAR